MLLVQVQCHQSTKHWGSHLETTCRGHLGKIDQFTDRWIAVDCGQLSMVEDEGLELLFRKTMSKEIDQAVSG